MDINTITFAKVGRIFELPQFFLDELLDLLIIGDIIELEERLFTFCRTFFNQVLQDLLTQLYDNESFISLLKTIGQSKGLSKFSKRPTNLRTRFGDRIEFESYYAEKSSPDYTAMPLS